MTTKKKTSSKATSKRNAQPANTAEAKAPLKPAKAASRSKKTATTAVSAPAAPLAASDELAAQAALPAQPVAEVIETLSTEPQTAPAPQPAQLTLTTHREQPVLTVGMLQKRLYELGFYHGQWDGQYGPLTREAVGHFQYRSGLLPDGHASTKTLAALGF